MSTAGADHQEVVVVDAVPTYRLGLETALAAARFEVARPADLRAWARGTTGAVVSISLRSSADERLLQELHAEQPTLPIVAVITADSDETFREALVMGAFSAVAWNEDTDEIVSVIAAALRGRSLLPLTVTRSLALSTELGPDISQHEKVWLRQLAEGVRITELAQNVGYSEREMHRLLQDIYSRLGTDNRSAALVKAQQLGLLQS